MVIRQLRGTWNIFFFLLVFHAWLPFCPHSMSIFGPSVIWMFSRIRCLKVCYSSLVESFNNLFSRLRLPPIPFWTFIDFSSSSSSPGWPYQLPLFIETFLINFCSIISKGICWFSGSYRKTDPPLTPPVSAQYC